MQFNRPGIIKLILLALVAMVAFFQLAWVGQTSAKLAVNKVWANRHLDAISRSADSAYGADFNGYTSFLRQEIPENARVVDTRTFGLVQYDIYGFLEYFLFPRTIIPLTDSTCRGESDLRKCILNLADAKTYLIYGVNFKISPSITAAFKVILYNQDMGLLAPKSVETKP
jgi:hypothetical protein